MAISNQEVIEAYRKTQTELEAIKTEYEKRIENLRAVQKKREEFILSTSEYDELSRDFIVENFVRERDRKAELKEVCEKDIASEQKKREDWLYKLYEKSGLINIPTRYGTIFKSAIESVTVADFEVIKEWLLVEPVREFLDNNFETENPQELEDLIQELISAIHLDFLEKRISKDAVLNVMGEVDEKTGMRPNPAPAGINYVALSTVRIRKK